MELLTSACEGLMRARNRINPTTFWQGDARGGTCMLLSLGFDKSLFYDEMRQALQRALPIPYRWFGTRGIVWYNDSHSMEQVHRVFDKAISATRDAALTPPDPTRYP